MQPWPHGGPVGGAAEPGQRPHTGGWVLGVQTIGLSPRDPGLRNTRASIGPSDTGQSLRS